MAAVEQEQEEAAEMGMMIQTSPIAEQTINYQIAMWSTDVGDDAYTRKDT